MRVAVLGLGLIGGSLVRRLAPQHDVRGYDVDVETRRQARDSGLRTADDLASAVAGRELIVLAVPLDALSTVVGQVASLLPPDAVLTDVGSVKQPVYAAVRGAGLAGRFVGGHPMAGTEFVGFAASDPGLYDGAAWVLCVEPDTVLSLWLRVARLLAGCGVRVVPATAAEHDDAVARISQLPHLLAAALATVAGAGGPLALTLAAGSFRDGTRVAGTPQGLPTAMVRSNGPAVDVAVAAAIELLRGDRDALLASGHDVRRGWPLPAGDPATLDAGEAGLADRLLRVGRLGGWLSIAEPDSLSVHLP